MLDDEASVALISRFECELNLVYTAAAHFHTRFIPGLLLLNCAVNFTFLILAGRFSGTFHEKPVMNIFPPKSESASVSHLLFLKSVSASPFFLRDITASGTVNE